MTKITAAERVFLSRAEAVTEKKRTRAAHYEQQLQVLMAERQPGDRSKLSKQILKIATQRPSPIMQTCQHTSPGGRSNAHHQREIRTETSQSDSGRSTHRPERPNGNQVKPNNFLKLNAPGFCIRAIQLSIFRSNFYPQAR